MSMVDKYGFDYGHYVPRYMGDVLVPNAVLATARTVWFRNKSFHHYKAPSSAEIAFWEFLGDKARGPLGSYALTPSAARKVQALAGPHGHTMLKAILCQSK